jgi:outer membrane protein assembly factor BamB
VLLFGDRVHQSAAIDGDVIYTIEGKRISPSETPAEAGANPRPYQWGTTPRRTRSNWLSAYQTAGGKAVWTRSASDDDKEASADTGFLSAPVPAGGLLVAPLTDGGAIWLLGLDRATGKTVWRAYLCDEPQGGADPWAETVLAIDGREAYLTCGCGVVFAVDAGSGNIRWAVRYQRDGQPNAMQQRMYGGRYNTTLELNGWDDDVVIPAGRALVVLSSDCDKLLALDRRTGELLWESPRTSPLGSVASYCLGVHGRGLFVAGKNVVRRYDLISGRLIWEKEIADSFGRGCVTSDAIYLPVRD